MIAARALRAPPCARSELLRSTPSQLPASAIPRAVGFALAPRAWAAAGLPISCSALAAPAARDATGGRSEACISEVEGWRTAGRGWRF